MNNCVLIGITEIKQSMDNAASIEDRFKSAIKQAKNHWLVTNEDDQLKMAIGAVLVTATEDEKERINKELDTIRTMNAAIGGVPIDLESLDMNYEPIGILKLWGEIKEQGND